MKWKRMKRKIDFYFRSIRINVQFLFGCYCCRCCLLELYVCVFRVCVGWIALCCCSTQLNKKQPELQRFIRLSIVPSKCETMAHKIQTICIVHDATMSFIYHWTFFFHLSANIFFRLLLPLLCLCMSVSFVVMIQWLNMGNFFLSHLINENELYTLHIMA